MIDLSFQLPIALALSLLLISSGLHKLRTIPRFKASLIAYDLLPAAVLAPAARMIPAAELLIGASLLIQPIWPVSGPVSAALLGLYALAMGLNLARGREHIDCGCGDKPQPLSLMLVFRNLLLCAAGLLVGSPGIPRDLGIFDLIIVAMAVATLALTYIAFEQLSRNALGLKQWRNNT
jgi:hypothetical protein